MRIKAVLLSLITVVVGCNRDKTVYVQEGESYELQFSLSTKAGSPGDETYRTVLFSYNDLSEYYGSKYTGSYRNRDVKDWMTPCQVNATTGEWIADGSEYGLRASKSGTYKLCIVTPAVQPNWFTVGLGGNYSKWGYHLQRTGDGLKISSPVSVNVAGNHINRKWVYEASANEMKERRAKVTVKLECGEDLAVVHVNKLMFKNIYSDAYYDFASDSLHNLTLDAVGEILHDSGDPAIELLHGEPATTVCTDFYLFALDYDRIDDEFHFLYDVPQLEVTMGSGIVLVPLHYELAPQHSYTYSLTINSAFIKMSITALPWNESSGDQDETVGATITDTFTFDAGTWNIVDGGTGEI